MADSIAVGVPRNWKKAVLAVRESGGTMINVSDERDSRCHALHRAPGGNLRRTGGGHRRRRACAGRWPKGRWGGARARWRSLPGTA